MEKLLSTKDKICYGIGAFGDTAMFNLLTVYLLFFFTDVVGMGPIQAGNILSVSILVSSVYLIFIGYLSDARPFKDGFRAPFLRISLLPTFVFSVMVFYALKTGHTTQYIYYITVNSLLWVSHATYTMPHTAAAGELSGSTEERISLRSYSRFFMGFANLFVLVFFIKAIEFFEMSGAVTENAWLFSAACVSAPALVCSTISWRFIRSREAHAAPAAETRRLGNIVKDHLEVLMLKPMRYVLVVTMFFSASNTFFFAVMIYFLEYNMGADASGKAGIFLIISIGGIIVTPLVSRAAHKIGNEEALTSFYIVAGLGMLILGLLGVNSIFLLGALAAVFTIGMSSHWQLIFTLMYSVGDYNVKLHGKNRQGVIVALTSSLYRLLTAVYTKILSFVLFTVGYDSLLTQQSSLTLKGIEIMFIFIPVLFLFLSAASLFAYIRKYKR